MNGVFMIVEENQIEVAFLTDIVILRKSIIYESKSKWLDEDLKIMGVRNWRRKTQDRDRWRATVEEANANRRTSSQRVSAIFSFAVGSTIECAHNTHGISLLLLLLVVRLTLTIQLSGATEVSMATSLTTHTHDRRAWCSDGVNNVSLEN
jgi:hypothetical protein